MFGLKEQAAMITHINTRTEKVGDKDRLACDVSVALSGPATLLDQFDERLKTTFFMKDDEEPQADFDDDNPLHLTKIRLPNIGRSQSLDMKSAGYKAVVHSLLGKSDLELFQLEIDKVRFECKEGGSVIISFRVIVRPSPEEYGALGAILATPITLSLTPPSPEEQAQMELNNAA